MTIRGGRSVSRRHGVGPSGREAAAPNRAFVWLDDDDDAWGAEPASVFDRDEDVIRGFHDAIDRRSRLSDLARPF